MSQQDESDPQCVEASIIFPWPLIKYDDGYSESSLANHLLKKSKPGNPVARIYMESEYIKELGEDGQLSNAMKSVHFQLYNVGKMTESR